MSEFETKPCEACRGHGYGVHPNGSDWDCEECDGEGEVCAECGAVECVLEGQCVREEIQRREDETRARYEARRKERRELAARRVEALNVAIGSLRVGAVEPHASVLAELRDELRDELTGAAGR